MTTPILQVDDLHLMYRARGREVHALQGATIEVRPSEIVGIVGESGSGKSTLARSLLGLLPRRTAEILRGSINIDGVDVTHYTQRQWEKVRGRPVAIVFQDPLTFLNPVMRIDHQIAEGIRKHDSGNQVAGRVRELLDIVRLPETVANAYPHELSGGMRQRVLLAIALGCRPRLLVADEPTTALDVTTQAEILKLLSNIQTTLDVSILIVSHNLAVIAGLCQRIYVMYGGRTIESGQTNQVTRAPAHPYTYGLMLAARTARDEKGRFATIPGDVPSLMQVFPGCPFVSRCSVVVSRCADEVPPQFPVPGEEMHRAACWLTAVEEEAVP